jgi:hypothetical protein
VDSSMLTVDSNTTLEIGTASAATVDFANTSGTTGNLVLDDSKDFTGQIVGFTGNGTPTNSDSIDLKDIHFTTAAETYTENSAGTGGTLTVSDGTHTANLNFSGDYVLANFKFSSDASGGTLIIDPPVTEIQNTSSSNPPSSGGEDPSPQILVNANDDTSSQHGDVLANLIGSFQNGQGNATEVITNLASQFESAGKLELDNLLAAHGNQLQQLQELVQGLTDGHNPLTNAGQLQQLAQDLASGHNPLVNSGEETIHIGQVDPHHGFIHA